VVSSNDEEVNLYLQQHKPLGVPLVSDWATSTKIMYNMIEPVHDIIGVSLSDGWTGMISSWLLSKEKVDWLHEEGRKVAVFMADDKITQEKCFGMGVDFILTHRPDLLAQTARAIRKL